MMYCEKCGYRLSDSAQFCPNCGNKIVKNGLGIMSEEVLDTEIQMRVKPTFKYGYMLLTPMIIVMMYIVTFIPLLAQINKDPSSTMIIVAFLISIILIAAVITFIDKKHYDGSCYDFYKTKVIYRDNFLNFSEKEVKYKYIREVTMRQSFVQKQFNLGSIILYTNAETGSRNGIFIKNVENVQQVYEDIKYVIGV